MTYDDIRRSIHELKAELNGCRLTRAERRAGVAEVSRLEAQAAEQLTPSQAETSPPNR